jgi:hypothetical protein
MRRITKKDSTAESNDGVICPSGAIAVDRQKADRSPDCGVGGETDEETRLD